MKLAQVHDFADQAPALHELDCELFELPAAPTDWLADIETDHDDLIRYAQTVRPCYDRIGRIIGYLEREPEAPSVFGQGIHLFFS